jgi:photosystem II stability/assembly factor-like uncharacterized protein
MRLKFAFILLFNSVLWSQYSTLKVVDFKLYAVQDASIRALLVDGSRVWYGSKQGRVGYFDFKTDSHFSEQIPEAETLEFRSLAGNNKEVLALTAGSPAYLIAINKETKQIKKRYFNAHKDIFFDGLKAMNEKEFFAFGDPIDGNFVLLSSIDGGSSWQEDYRKLVAQSGEAAFAASNSSLVAHNGKIWIFTGGMAANVYCSKNHGKSWSRYSLPIIQGMQMAGVFSADFYDGRLGFAVGGNYEDPENNNSNKIITKNGGKKWELVANGTAFGYASCVKFIPHAGGKAIMVLDKKGFWYSADFGNTWSFILDASDLYVFEFISKNKICAAGKNKIMLFEFR